MYSNSRVDQIVRAIVKTELNNQERDGFFHLDALTDQFGPPQVGSHEVEKAVYELCLHLLNRAHYTAKIDPYVIARRLLADVEARQKGL